jgi:hypothetical protein
MSLKHPPFFRSESGINLDQPPAVTLNKALVAGKR